MTGLEEVRYPYHPFKHDLKRHKDFKCAKRYALSLKKEGNSLPTLTLSSEEADLLRKGLAPVDMDDRWEGNLADSKANEDAREVVVRLYRTWTAFLIFEARYRPEGKGDTLTLYEFAFESDEQAYRSSDLKHELSQYESVVRMLLETISSRTKNSVSRK